MPRADSTMVRRALILAPGRSGSTLLQSAFLSSCDALTFFEPCRHSPIGDVRKDHCVAQVLRFLDCNLPQRNGAWDPPEIKGWLRHPYSEANTSCTPPPLLSVEQTAAVCQQAQLVFVKEIRLVGELSRVAKALAQSERKGITALIHLVRDPRPMLASQRRLLWWNMNSEMSRRRRAMEIERVAKRTCDGMVRDADAGDALLRSGQTTYILVRFEELTSELEATTLRLYAQLGRPVLHSTRLWLNRTLAGQCSHGNDAANAEKFEYSTCRARQARRRPQQRWKHVLTMLEKRAISRVCSHALARFGYDTAFS